MTKKRAIQDAIEYGKKHPGSFALAYEATAERAIENGIILGLRMAAKMGSKDLAKAAHCDELRDLATKREKRLRGVE